MKLTEDDLYRRSSQYKHWSFTPSKLVLLREQTNVQASVRVKANVARQRAERAKNLDTASESERANTPGAENGNGGAVGGKEVDCLTAAEEMRLVDKFCKTALDLGKFIKASPEVTVSTFSLYFLPRNPKMASSNRYFNPQATTIQYLRRFYLYNSPMTYEGQKIAIATMFIASKTEGGHMSSSDYAAKFQNITRDEVLAPEHIIIQALRFNLDVRHPFHGLKGAHVEMGEMVKGTYVPLEWDTRTGAVIQAELLKLPKKTGVAPMSWSEDDFRKRLDHDYGVASNILKTSAQLTDAYFHYTPSQIMLAAHFLADEPLTLFLLSTKLPNSSPIYTKTRDTIRACAAMLSSHSSYTASSTPPEDKEARDKKEKAEVAAIIKKLRQCRDPEKIDLVKANEARKRDAVQDGELDERKAKRRKLDRENAQKEADDFWGPELPKKA
jgi:cyclin H